MDPLCASRNATDAYVRDTDYLCKPELLSISCPSRSVNGATTWEKFAYRVSLEEEICLFPGGDDRYTLVRGTFIMGDSWNTSPGHVMVAVRAPSGNITIINDDLVFARGPRSSSNQK